MPPSRHSLSGHIIAYRHLAEGCRAALAMSLLCSRRRRTTMTMVVGVAWVSLLFVIRQQLKPHCTMATKLLQHSTSLISKATTG